MRRAGWLVGPTCCAAWSAPTCCAAWSAPTLAATTSFGQAVGALAVYGAGTSTGNLTCNSVLHTGVPDRTRGRVFTFHDVVWQTTRLASTGLGGILADAYRITVAYLTGGALLLTAGVLGVSRAGPPPTPASGRTNPPRP